MKRLRGLLRAGIVGLVLSGVPMAALAQYTYGNCRSADVVLDAVSDAFKGIDYAGAASRDVNECYQVCLQNSGCVEYHYCSDIRYCTIIFRDVAPPAVGNPILSGDYSCGSNFEALRLRANGDKVEGEYKASWNGNWRGVISFTRNASGVWHGDWGQPDIGRWGYLSDIVVSGDRIPAKRTVYP